MLRCPGPAASTPWKDDGRCCQLIKFIKAVSAQKVGPSHICLSKHQQWWTKAHTCRSKHKAVTRAILANIVLSLQMATIQDPIPASVIRLESAAVWLAMPAVASADLYVRPCYPELFKAREEYIKRHKWESGCMTVFTGTPGVFRNAWNL